MLAKDRTRTHIASNDPATLKKYKKTDNYNHTIIKYIENVRTMSKSTASQYQKRLKSFVSFVEQEYEYNVDILIDKVKEQRMDVYDVLSGFASFLVNRGTFSSLSIKNWVDTAKNLLEFFDIDVSPKKFKMKVRLPKVVRKSKDALTKELIVEILNACSDIRLKTYVLLLAATGMRPTETLSIRICDLNLDSKGPNTVFVRGEYTKTRADRYVYLTKEATKQLKTWIEFKYRTRRTSYYHKDTGNSISEYRTPQKNNRDLVFSAFSSPTATSVSLQSLYVGLGETFGKTLDRIDMGQREDSPGTKRRKITLHSFRRWVKSTISDLGHSDYSEYFIGHAGSTYYRKSDKEKEEIFMKIEPYLTYTDITSLQRKGAEAESRIEELETINLGLKQRNAANSEEIVSLREEIDSVKLMMQNILENVSKTPDQQQKDAMAKSLLQSKLLKPTSKENIVQ
ncbi:MAG: site-specific integrase [Nitrososphaeraceae archaeon]